MAAQLGQVQSIALSASGILYAVDPWQNNIRAVSLSGIISTLVGSGSGGVYGFAGDGGPAAAALIRTPFSVTTIGEDVYFTERDNNIVRCVRGGIISTVVGDMPPQSYDENDPPIATMSSYSDDQWVVVGGSLRVPVSVLAYPDGSGFVVSTGSYERIYSYNLTTKSLTRIAGTTGFAGNSGDEAPATSASINTNWAYNNLVWDAAGNLLLVDQTYAVIRVISIGGNISTLTFVDPGLRGEDALLKPNVRTRAVGTRIFSPSGVAAGPNASIAATSYQVNVVYAIDATGALKILAGSLEKQGMSGNGGPATAATFKNPTGIVYLRDGSLVIADSGNNGACGAAVHRNPPVIRALGTPPPPLALSPPQLCASLTPRA